jgi:hypothetical protein
MLVKQGLQRGAVQFVPRHQILCHPSTPRIPHAGGPPSCRIYGHASRSLLNVEGGKSIDQPDSRSFINLIGGASVWWGRMEES